MTTTLSPAKETIVTNPEPRTTQGLVSRTLRQSGYLLSSFPVATLGFVFVMMMASLGIALSPLVGGLFILVATIDLSGWLADGERRMHRSLLHRELPEPRRESFAGLPRYSLARLKERQGWLDMVWTLLRFVISTVTFSIAISWWGLITALVITPLEMLFPSLYPKHVFTFGLLELSDPAQWTFQFVIGFLALVTLPFVIDGLTSVQTRAADVLLGGQTDLEAQVEDLTQSRDAGRQAEADQLRKLERDLHDGPQQRLVRLQMDLARAERMMATDPEKAAAIIAESKANAGDTLHELRDLSKRVAPPVLTDRGLRAAVTELASQSLIPVEVSVQQGRFPAHVESAAYYVVSESLANANKHSGASTISVDVSQHTDDLMIVVRDDGIGGADLSKGHGLAGLQERLRSVDGRLSVISPAGGPTMLQAVIPCGS